MHSFHRDHLVRVCVPVTFTATPAASIHSWTRNCALCPCNWPSCHAPEYHQDFRPIAIPCASMLFERLCPFVRNVRKLCLMLFQVHDLFDLSLLQALPDRACSLACTAATYRISHCYDRVSSKLIAYLYVWHPQGVLCLRCLVIRVCSGRCCL